MTKLKRVMVMVIAMLVMAIATVVFATDDTQTISNTNVNSLDALLNVNSGNNTAENNNLSAINPIGNTNNTNNTTSTYNNTTNLPKTGAGDYTMILVIGIFAVIAVYAYKKIRDYKGV